MTITAKTKIPGELTRYILNLPAAQIKPKPETKTSTTTSAKNGKTTTKVEQSPQPIKKAEVAPKISGELTRRILNLPAAQIKPKPETKPATKTTIKTSDIQQFKYDNPDVIIPQGQYGAYDIVKTVTTKKPTLNFPAPFKPSFIDITTQQYLFTYSPEAQHKIGIAGSVENYDALYREIQQNPAVGVASGWTGQGLANVDVAYYRLTGDEKKAMETQIGQVYKTRQLDIKELNPLSEKSAWFSIVKAPSTQLAVGYGIGAAWGAGSKAAHGYLAGKALFGASKALTVAEVATGATMIGVSGKDILQDVQKGDIGKALAKSNLLAGSFAAGYKGYVRGAKLIKVPSIIGQGSEPIITSVKREKLQIASSKTGINDINMVTVKTIYKPLKTKDLYITFPKNKAEMMSVGVGDKTSAGILSKMSSISNEFKTWWGGRRIYTINRAKVEQIGGYIGESKIESAYFEKVYRNPNWDLEQFRINQIAGQSLVKQLKYESMLKIGYESPTFKFSSPSVTPVFSLGTKSELEKINFVGETEKTYGAISIVKPISKQIFELKSLVDQDFIFKRIVRQKKGTKQTLDLRTEQIKTVKSKQKKITEPVTSIITPFSPILPTAYGRGQRGSIFDLFGERKRERGTKIFNPLKELRALEKKL